ncbi:hypothetical protein GQ53DRAFT_642306 [Thozetella sp. PMI_491]|nr:hypothetical protein GQ53DRAFT_642306 [Thozetella sp. PMI_491]
MDDRGQRGQEPTPSSTPARPQATSIAGKRLSDERLQVLERLLQIQKLTNHDIAFALDCDERTVRRRRYQYQQLGKLRHKHPEVAKNAEKLKPKHLEKLQEWLKDNENVLLDDMQEFLRRECGLEVSVSTISRQLKRASGNSTKRQHGAKARLKLKLERHAEGRELNFKLRRTGDDDEASSAGDGTASVQQRQDPLQVPVIIPPTGPAVPVVPMMTVAPMVPIDPMRQIPQVLASETVFQHMALAE